jgi:hypothetical protein
VAHRTFDDPYGKSSSALKGREQIGTGFAAYLANFVTVYHINGQQTVDLRGDTATGVAYCLVVLIGVENGKRIKKASSTNLAIFSPGSDNARQRAAESPAGP